jgi:transposase
MLALGDGHTIEETASLLQVSGQSVRNGLHRLLHKGVSGLVQFKKPSGRPAKLTKTQRRELGKMLDAGPSAAGFTGNCWRSPMIQSLIEQRFGVLYSVHYLSELLRSMGFSYQKASFVSDHLNEQARRAWLAQTWPEIEALGEQKNAHILFGDEASFPQWGTLSYTWARRGCQPVTKTSGKRKGYKVLGLIDYFTGRFYYRCQEGRLNSASYAAFIEQVLRQTRKHIILIQDGARYHTSAAMKPFFEQHRDRLTVFQLPSYSPDFNPLEKLWKKIKEQGTHLHHFPTFEALKDKVEEALLDFKHAPRP